MSIPELSAGIQRLIWNQLRTVDHVAVLLAVRALESADVLAVSAHTTLNPNLVAEILEELYGRCLVTRYEFEFRFEPDSSLRDDVAQLAEMYNTKPVTLVRAIYDRPAHVIQQFADAFRLRRDGASK